MDNTSTATLNTELQRLAAGKIDSLRYFYMAYAGRIRAFAYRLTADMPIAEDITHNVFLKLWEQHENMLHIESIEAYLYRTTRNITLNHIKHMNVERDYRSAFTAEEAFDDYEARELSAQLTAVIKAMPARQRRVFIMSRFQRMTYAEISQQLGISTKTVQYHIHEALSTLRKALFALFF